MKIAYVTTYNAQDVHQWSGTGYYIARSLSEQSILLDYIGPLQDRWSHKVVRKIKRHYHELSGKRYLRDPEPIILKDYAQEVSQKLAKVRSDIVFSVTSNPIAYLESQKPIVFYADATFAGLNRSYPHYSQLCQETVRDWHRMEQLALQKSNLAIFASDWAAQTAIEHYNADPDKVKVVPFGANLENSLSLSEVQEIIKARSNHVCKLIFLGVDWARKGGDIALKVAELLNASGLKTELTIVGCEPDSGDSYPDFVRPLGFISKATQGGKEKIAHLLADSHFLILPTRAECYGLVFCEANAMGVPCVATAVGGVPTIIKNDINGRLFAPAADISEYCQYITAVFTDYDRYQALALSAFNEYRTRLNWSVAGKTIKRLLMDL
ncbi:glycosyltransferase family 4 protein [Thermocoleostomius sinensis]|uniref:Glycosyltransferase family 4 protein n=1 Tax=Thermocoleostomius sinensis A174 TaxID=2016057 RepID=A0A9E8ZHC0_9CYAN|nr:glycosyltransferase family 4 protein [Thermocoleostomius sinensis]WAL62766.1 glycosyltransferase family 4 protein [Thermocoleostomius sinensis A174]